MANRYYTADSAVLLPSFPMLHVWSDVTGGWAIVPDAEAVVDDISLSPITASIS